MNTNAPATPTPPELPPLPTPNNHTPDRAFAAQYGPMDPDARGWLTVDALLKRPAQVVFELIEGARGATYATLLLVTLVTVALYGLVVGAFAGGAQYWAVPLKLLAGLLLSGVLCLPSLYILISLAGGRQSLPQAASLLTLMLALAGVLLVGFAPIAWLFSQSTRTAACMGALHLLFWFIALNLAFRLLHRATVFLNRRGMAILVFWGMLFTVVTLQMATALRPLVGPAKPLQLAEKQFFLTHWFETMTGE